MTDPKDPFNTLRPTIYELNARQKAVFTPVAAGIRLLYKTWRFSTDPREVASLSNLNPPYVLIGWHNLSFSAPPVLRKYFPKDAIDCLFSASKAAAWEVAFYRLFGIQSIRGSTTRRSIHATREMLQSLEKGRIVLLSPDGPSGPLYTFQAGAVTMAQKRALPIVAFAIHPNPCLRAKSWDRHLFPFPFSRIRVRFQIFPESLISSHDIPSLQKKLRRDYLASTFK